MVFRHFAAVFVLAVGLHAHAENGTVPKTTPKPATAIKVAKVTVAPIADSIEALGNLVANETVDVTVHFAEFVRDIRFKEGQRVAKGDVLLVLENAEEKAQLQEAKYTLEEAQSQLSRIKAIAGRGDASQSLLDERQREYNVAKARYAGIESRLKDHVVSAPFAGLVGLRNISPGAYMAPGDVITTLIDDSAMKLDFRVPAVFLSLLETGISLTATTRAFPGEHFTGSVTTLDNKIDPISRTVTVRALLPNPKGVLKPGLLMEVLLRTDERKALLVPEEAIVPKARKHFVMVVDSESGDTLVKQQEVSVGARSAGMAEILSGLNQGETIVIHGADKLRNNSTVTIVDDFRQDSTRYKNSGDK